MSALEQTFDVYPATVTIGDRTFRRARAYTAGGRLYVVQAAAGGAEVVADVELADLRRERRSLEGATADGERFVAARQGGCGCGSPLKRADVAGMVRRLEAERQGA